MKKGANRTFALETVFWEVLGVPTSLRALRFFSAGLNLSRPEGLKKGVSGKIHAFKEP